uniref:Uncharacterized protein n=1 Tax=Nannospalax galili TaxID=1026970 RepID=A0A8C6R1Z1_NANGA
MGAMTTPDCIITCDGNNTTFCCTLGENFEETTANGRKTQMACTFTDGALVQHQQWDGKENGKLVVDCVTNNVTCTRVYKKVE